MKIASFIAVSFLLLVAAEKPVTFIPAKPDPIMGDWEGKTLLAQVIPATPGHTRFGPYQAALRKGFDNTEVPLVVMFGDGVNFSGDGEWKGTIKDSQFFITRGPDKWDLQKIERTSPTLGQKPPAGAVVLFEGKNLDAWAKKAGKDWLKEDGPAPWKVADGAVEVVPGSDCIITHQKFGDCHLHVEFRTLGSPTNSGVFLQDRYEVNINETFGTDNRTRNGGLDNCSDVPPRVSASLTPLAWQTYDIDFKAPKFDSSNKKTEPAHMTVVLNGVKIYDNQALDVPHGAGPRLGEAPTGPLMLQEHGMPLQFRNIWIVETK